MSYYNNYEYAYNQYVDYGLNQYDEYGQYMGPMVLPPPDPNWVDPLITVRQYLKQIQKDVLLQEYKGLKETNIYNLEIFVEALQMKINEFNIKEGQTLNIQVKLLDFGYMDFNHETSPEHTSILSTTAPGRNQLLQDLLQALFTGIYVERQQTQGSLLESEGSGNIVNELNEIVDETQNEDGRNFMLKNDGKQYTSNYNEDIEKNREEESSKSSDVQEEDILIEVNQGKSLLVVESGVGLIEKLQRYPIIVQATVREGELRDEVVAEAETSFRLNESFPRVVLGASVAEAVLPMLAVMEEFLPLLSNDGTEIGAARITVRLACVGHAATQSCRGVRGYENYIHERFTAHNTFAQAPVRRGKLKEIVQDCIASSHLQRPPEQRLRNSCQWYHLAQESIGSDDHCMVCVCVPKEDPLDAEWRKVRPYCRNWSKAKDTIKRESLYERLENLKAIESQLQHNSSSLKESVTEPGPATISESLQTISSMYTYDLE